VLVTETSYAIAMDGKGYFYFRGVSRMPEMDKIWFRNGTSRYYEDLDDLAKKVGGVDLFLYSHTEEAPND
jgi:hypothetical protein